MLLIAWPDGTETSEIDRLTAAWGAKIAEKPVVEDVLRLAPTMLVVDPGYLGDE